jgi:ComEC/Rec2-related protein
MKHPLVPVSLVYAAGLVAGHWLEAPVAAAFCGVAVTAVTALFWKAARPWPAVAALLLFGWLNLTLRTAVISPHDLRAITGEHPALVRVRGVLAAPPTQRVFIRDGRESWRTQVELRAGAIQAGAGNWRRAHGRIMTVTSGLLATNLLEGQVVEVRGALGRPAPPVAPGVFDHRWHLESRGVYREMRVDVPGEWRAVGPLVSPPLSSRFRAWAQDVLARGLPPPDEALKLQWAMLLGWQTALTNEVSEPFMRSGTMHIFAISGLHIALIAGIFVVLLRAFLVPRLACGLVVIPLIWFYTAATGWQPSAVRSTVMMTVVIGGWMIGRPGNLLNSLAAAGFIILLWDPRQLFQASFQLSFFVVLSIALLLPRLEQLKERVLKPDPLLPMEVRPRWQRWGIHAGNTVWMCFATSLAAFLGSLPLIAFYFHLFTPGSLLANLLVVPVSALALMSGLGAVLTGNLLPAGTELFNHSGWFFMRAMMWLSERATALPASWMHVRPPGPLEFTFYYGALLALLTGVFRRPRLRWLAGGGLAVIALALLARHVHARGFAELHVVPARETVAVCGRNAGSDGRWLVSCGDTAGFDFVLKPFLQAQGINHLDPLVLPAGDSDHSGATPELVKLFPPSRIFAAPQMSRSMKFRTLVAELAAQFPVETNVAAPARAGPWTMLAPKAGDRFERTADGAMVLKGEFGGVHVLLLPSLGLAGQNALFNHATDLRADIVITELPGTDEPLAGPLLERIRPKLIIVGDSEPPSGRRASPALRARLQRAGAPVLFMHDTGAVRLRCRDGRWTVHPSRE